MIVRYFDYEGWQFKEEHLESLEKAPMSIRILFASGRAKIIRKMTPYIALYNEDDEELEDSRIYINDYIFYNYIEDKNDLDGYYHYYQVSHSKARYLRSKYKANLIVQNDE